MVNELWLIRSEEGSLWPEIQEAELFIGCIHMMVFLKTESIHEVTYSDPQHEKIVIQSS